MKMKMMVGFNNSLFQFSNNDMIKYVLTNDVTLIEILFEIKYFLHILMFIDIFVTLSYECQCWLTMN